MTYTTSVVARVATMKVVGLPDTIRTVAQDQFNATLADFVQRSENDVMHVVADSLDKAYQVMALQLRDFFAPRLESIKLDPGNVAFELSYSELKNGGLFWGTLSSWQPGSAHTLLGQHCPRFG